jgi:hypothetical protein
MLTHPIDGQDSMSNRRPRWSQGSCFSFVDRHSTQRIEGIQMTLFDSLVLANGAVIPNRLCKAAMEENMSTYDHAPSEAHYKLYRSWAEGLSGNVMIDRRALTGPDGVILENDEHLDRFREWARAGRNQGTQFWLQINHPGRQVLATLGQETLAPSAVALADCAHFGRAAEQCHVSQPTLSTQIKKLEEYLRVSLIDRNSKPASLTPTGCMVVNKARRIIQEFQRRCGGVGGARPRLLSHGDPFGEPAGARQIMEVTSNYRFDLAHYTWVRHGRRVRVGDGL